MKKFSFILIAILLLTAALVACDETKKTDTEIPAAEAVSDVANNDLGYRQITGEEVQEMMKTESGYIILDVRTQEEYDEGHIPGAICISHDSIPTGDIPQLPDQDQLIMVYCRSGRRSKLAAEQLVKQGYTNIVEFGGIIDWTGEITTE